MVLHRDLEHQIRENVQDIEAVFHFEMLSRNYVVVIMADGTKEFFEKLLRFQAAAGPTRVICIRTWELPYCSVPDRFSLEEINIHWYLIHETPLFRKDGFNIPETAVVSSKERFEFALEHIVHFVRNHVILKLLAMGHFARLIQNLDHYVAILISAALVVEDRHPTPCGTLNYEYPDINLLPRGVLGDACRDWVEARRCIASSRMFTQLTAHQAVRAFESLIHALRS